MKLIGIAETGGHAKFVIQNGEVKVNGEIETQRRKKVIAGDLVEVGGKKMAVDQTLLSE